MARIHVGVVKTICGIVVTGLMLASQPAAAQFTPPKERRQIEQPDLVVDDVSFTMLKPVEAANGVLCLQFSLKTTIRNAGPAGTGGRSEFAIWRHAGNARQHERVGNWAVPALAAGESVTLGPHDFSTCKFDSQNNATPDPRRVFRVIADSRGDIAESNERNNWKEATFRPPMTSKSSTTGQ